MQTAILGPGQISCIWAAALQNTLLLYKTAIVNLGTHCNLNTVLCTPLHATFAPVAPVEGRLLLQLTSQKAEATYVLQRQRKKNARRGKAAAAHCSQNALPPNPL
jgi:hypothetical protein